MTHIIDAPVASRTINISSKEAYKPTGNVSELEISLREAISCGINQNFLVSVRSATIPYSWYNISSNNNTIRYGPANDETTTYQITLTQGNYSAYQLASEISAKILSQSGDVVQISYSTTRNKYSYTIPLSEEARALRFYWSLSSATYFLGELPNINRTFIPGNSYESIYQLQLFPYTMLYIKSDLVQANTINNSGIFENILETIPVNCPPFGVVQFLNSTNHKTLITNRTIDTIRIRIQDEDGNLINLNNKHYTLCIQIDTIYSREFKEELSIVPEYLRAELQEEIEAFD